MKNLINKYKHYVYCIIFLSGISPGRMNAQNLENVQQIKNEYDKFKQEKTNIDASPSNLESNQLNNGVPQKVDLIPYSNIEDLGSKQNYHFGYDFFTNRDTLAFWENLPTPSNYLLGSGDELVISLWGETQLRQVYTISREGKIYDDKVGLLNLGGKSINEAQNYLKEQFGRMYSTLSVDNPTTFIDISLGKLQSINVNFVGQVKYPGIHPVHPFSDIITGLVQVGGVDTTGSLREIIIKRVGEPNINIDLYDYLISGNRLPSSAQLRNQDIIVVKPRYSIILIDSAVIRSGYYESVFGETVFDMLQYAGGPAYDASNLVSIKSLKLLSDRANGFVYQNSYLRYEDTKSLVVNSGDEIILQRLLDETQKVELIGQVKAPGKYNYYNGITLNQLLKIGGGFNDSTFIKSVYLNKAEIIRRNPNGRYDQVISINLNNFLKNNSEDILLENLDRVVIHANLNFFEKENIQVVGEVNVPGSYPIISDGESLNSLLLRSGGLTTKALENGITIYRDKKYFEFNFSNKSILNKTNNNNSNTLDEQDEIMENEKLRVAWENINISLMPGDSIVVKEKTTTVFIDGSVYNPGVLEFRKKKSLRYYINAAGGLTNRADKKGIVVLYANGIVSPKKWYTNPKVLEGCTIIVNEKLPEEPFDMTQFATNWTSIISSLITAIILSQQL